MAIWFTRKKKRRVKYRLSPKEAEVIIKQEFTDDKGTKTYTDINVKPHSPSTPTIQGVRDYKE